MFVKANWIQSVAHELSGNIFEEELESARQIVFRHFWVVRTAMFRLTLLHTKCEGWIQLLGQRKSTSYPGQNR